MVLDAVNSQYDEDETDGQAEAADADTAKTEVSVITIRSIATTLDANDLNLDVFFILLVSFLLIDLKYRSDIEK